MGLKASQSFVKVYILSYLKKMVRFSYFLGWGLLSVSVMTTTSVTLIRNLFSRAIILKEIKNNLKALQFLKIKHHVI